ncbi:ketopantoate reductase family protein [Paenibacillus daejeonensis]|uniref:ketopantoate reductase family protein n=1 Tax=Paenibacillus daejeonensis TaxID=135193 RepID=UPI00037B2C09|nr:2-dehydropantoate 2-reductase [Paenibacillus daejeonensis]
MRWLIIGGGAIGLLYAARLASGDQSVCVGTRTTEQAALLSREGIGLITDAGEARLPVKAYAMEPDSIGSLRNYRPEVVMLTVKQYQITEDLIEQVGRVLPEQTPVYCLQNGIGHLTRLQACWPRLQVLAASTTEAALRSSPSSVRYTGAGELWLEEGTPSGSRETNHQKMLLAAMKKAGITVFLSNQMEDRMYRKLLLNCVINPLTALYGVKNGELPADEARLAHMKAIHEETAAILHAAGLELSGDEWNHVLELCRLTAKNESSMLRDIRAGRPTELAWINGGVVALANRLGLAAPCNEEVVERITLLDANR